MGYSTLYLADCGVSRCFVLLVWIEIRGSQLKNQARLEHEGTHLAVVLCTVCELLLWNLSSYSVW